MADKLAFVEVPAQLAHVPADYHVVSLSPLIEVALGKTGRPYTRPEDYLDEMALEEEGIANFAKVEALCAALDAIFADAVPEVAEHELQPARWHYFWLKIVYDAFSIRAYQLRRVLAAEAPREVLYFQRSQPDLNREWISQSESLYAYLLDHLLPALEIAGKRLEPVAEREAKRDVTLESSGSLLQRVRRSAGWRVRRVRQALEMLPRVLPRRSRGRVLCLDYGYSIPYIAPELERLGYDVWVWRDPASVYRVGSLNKHILEATVQLSDGEVAAIWRVVERNRTVRDLFCWEGYDLWPAVAPRLRRLVERGLPAVLNHYAAAQSMLKQLQPDAVLMSMASFAWEKTICHAARRAGVPTVVSRHGELGTHHVPMMVYQDIDAVAWALCWGKWEAAWTRRWARWAVQVRITGAPMVEQASRSAPTRAALRARLGIGQHERVVLYVPTALDFNWRYISHRNPSDSTYFRHQRSIVTGLCEVDSCRVLVKVHSGSHASPLAVWIQDNLPGRVTCIASPNFSELIHLPDVIVLDAPATTLVQAVQSSARIYIYNSWFRWEPGVLNVLRRTCVISDDFEEWGKQLQNDLISGRAFEPRRPDPELLAGLADPMEEVGGATRATAQAIAAIVAEIRSRRAPQGLSPIASLAKET